jgi:crotonobetainyl-CoA:carnitine CoA-transferase CaiB-like acyl-CoA transferase
VLSDHMGGRTFEPALGSPGYARLTAPDRRPYRTRDGHICVLVYTDKQWRALFDAIGRTEEFLAHPWLPDHASRAQHYPELYAMLADIMAARSTAEWLDLLQSSDIPCMPLNDLDMLIDDPHLAAVGFFSHIEHPTEGAVRLATGSSRWSGTGPGIDRRPPRLGEHSLEVLREAGFAQEEIAGLLREGATVDGSSSEPGVEAAACEPAVLREG